MRQFDSLFASSHIPAIPIRPIKTNEEIINFLSVNDEQEMRHEKDYAYARSVSTYPTQDGKREGDPICDHYYLIASENRTFAALADGEYYRLHNHHHHYNAQCVAQYANL